MKTLCIALLMTALASTMPNDATLSKNWKLTEIVEFEVEMPPEEEQVNDYMNLKSDGTFDMVFYGKKKTGKWNNSKTRINFIEGNGKKFFFTIKSKEAKKVMVEYQHPSLIRTNLIYSVK